MKLFKKLFFIGLVNLIPSTSTLQPTVILLQSACSSGKTSLCNAIKQLSSNYAVISEDDLCFEIVPELLKKYFPNEYQLLNEYIEKEHIFYAVVRREIPYKKQACEKEKIVTTIRKIETVLNDPDKNKEFKEELNFLVNETRDKLVSQYIEHKQHVIIDAWMKKTDYYKEQFPNTPVVSIFAYTPLPQSFNFFKKRNLQAKNGDINNGKFYDQLIPSHVACYKLTATPTKTTLDALPKKAFDSIFDSIQPLVTQDWYSIKNADFSRREMNLARLLELRKTFLPDSLNDAIMVYIEPKEQHDYIIKTGFQTPTESAQQLIDIVENNTSNTLKQEKKATNINPK